MPRARPNTSAASFLPKESTLAALREAAAGCSLRGEPERREAEFAEFVGDLRFVASLL